MLLAICSAILWSIGLLIWFGGMVKIAIAKVGENASQEQLTRALREILIAQSAPPNRPATTVLFIGAFCGIIGLVLGIRSLVRGEGHTVKAIVACLVAALAIFCQLGMMMEMVQGHLVHP